MHIAVLGAGGVGGYFAGVLARAGNTVVALARGANLEAIRSRGLEVRAAEGSFVAPVTATDDPAALTGATFAIVAVKSYSLPDIASAARLLAEGGTTLLPLLNGVDATARLAGLGVPRSSVLPALTVISAARVAPGVIERYSTFRRIVLGEEDGRASARAEAVVGAFVGAGVDAQLSSRIEVELWRKFAFLAPMAAACGLARSTVGRVRSAPLGRLLITRGIEELVAVGKAAGVGLADDEVARTVAAIDALPAAMRPSFLADLERGGPAELDVLSGTVSRLGRVHGVLTPVHDTAVAALGAALGETGGAERG
jgi:2-dehydropantoate 2-reductase